jgi:hypothetical protein
MNWFLSGKSKTQRAVPTLKSKKARHKKHPKLSLHNMSLYNSSFFSGVPMALFYLRVI